MKKFSLISLVLIASLPSIAHGATNIGSILTVIEGILGTVVKIAVVIAFLFFIWGMAMFIKNSGSEEGRNEGKQRMLWGVIGLFVIISIWGIVKVINLTFKINNNETVPVPQFPRATTGGNDSSRLAPPGSTFY